MGNLINHVMSLLTPYWWICVMSRLVLCGVLQVTRQVS